jgi:hypothetical protein
LFSKEWLKNASSNLSRLFFASGWMGRDVEPHLKNIRDRDAAGKYARAEDGFGIRRYSYSHIRGAGGMIDRETETVQRIEIQTFEV